MAGDHLVPSLDTGFQVVRRGYDQAQVDDHLRRIDAEIRILSTDRDAAVIQSDQLNRELDDARVRAERLRAQVRSLVAPPQSVQGMSERMRSMLRLAEDEVADMLSRANSEATRRIHEAEQQAAQIVAGAQTAAAQERAQTAVDAESAAQDRAELTTQIQAERDAAIRAIEVAEASALQEREALRAQIENERHAAAQASAAADIVAAQTRDAWRAKIDEERHAAAVAIAAADEEAGLRRARAWTDSEARRTLVEEDFTIAMNQRRSEAIAAVAAEREAAREAAEAMRRTAAERAGAVIVEARAQAQDIVADSQRSVIELTTLRGQLVEQLGSIRGELDQIVKTLAPLPVESGEPVVEQAAPAAGEPVEEAPVAVAPRPATSPEHDAIAETPSGSANSGSPRRRTRSRQNATSAARR